MQRSTSDLELIQQFSSPEGTFTLIQILQLEGTTPQDLHSLLGTRISMASIKSSDQPTTVIEDKQVSNKFVEVPLEQTNGNLVDFDKKVSEDFKQEEETQMNK